jgi:hypothetical protein
VVIIDGEDEAQALEGRLAHGAVDPNREARITPLPDARDGRAVAGVERD